jgi:hypothetical protein
MANATSRRRSTARRTKNMSASSRQPRRSTKTQKSRPSAHKSTASRWSASRTQSRKSGAGQSYASVRQQFEKKIQSFQTLKNQCKGTPKSGRPSAATLNRWGSLINQGATIYQISGAQMNRATPGSQPCKSAGTAMKALRQKYGGAIKAVTQGKNKSWLVAASATKSKRFRPPWK